MAFIAISDDEVTTYNTQLNSDDGSDDDVDVNSFIERLHDSLKEFYARNKELKLHFLIQNNANLFRQYKNLKDENDNLQRVATDLHIQIDRKIKFCEMLNKEQGDLKRIMNNLN